MMKAEVILQFSFRRHDLANAYIELAKTGFLSDSIESIKQRDDEGYFKEEGDEERAEMDKTPFDLIKYLEEQEISAFIYEGLNIETEAELLPGGRIKFIANVGELMCKDYTKMSNKNILKEIGKYLQNNSLEDGTYESEDSEWIIYTHTSNNGKKYEYGLIDYRNNPISIRLI